MSRRITLLHLSDLQFGPHQLFAPDELLRCLAEDLDLLAREHDLSSRRTPASLATAFSSSIVSSI